MKLVSSLVRLGLVVVSVQALVACTEPDPVTELTAEAGNGNVQLAWGVSSGQPTTAVVIRRDTGQAPVTPDDGVEVVLGRWRYSSDGKIEVLDPNVTNGVEYFYSVFARDDSGNISDATSVSATPYLPPPGVHEDFKVYAGDGEVTVFWQSSTNISPPTYTVYYSERKGVSVSNGTSIGVVPGDGYANYRATITGLKNDTTYYFILAASNASGVGVSSEVSVTPKAVAAVLKTMKPIFEPPGELGGGLHWMGIDDLLAFADVFDENYPYRLSVALTPDERRTLTESCRSESDGGPLPPTILRRWEGLLADTRFVAINPNGKRQVQWRPPTYRCSDPEMDILNVWATSEIDVDSLLGLVITSVDPTNVESVPTDSMGPIFASITVSIPSRDFAAMGAGEKRINDWLGRIESSETLLWRMPDAGVVMASFPGVSNYGPAGSKTVIYRDSDKTLHQIDVSDWWGNASVWNVVGALDLDNDGLMEIALAYYEIEATRPTSSMLFEFTSSGLRVVPAGNTQSLGIESGSSAIPEGYFLENYR